MKRFNEAILNKTATLTVLGGTSVSVFVKDTTTLATLYSQNLVSPATIIENPTLTGADGALDFYVANGTYDLVIHGPNGDLPIDDVEIWDMDDVDARMTEIENEFALVSNSAAAASAAAAATSADEAAASAEDAASVTGAAVINFSGGATEGQPVHGSALASNNSRYDFTVTPEGWLEIEFIAAAVERVLWRTPRAGHRDGRVYSQTSEFLATNFSGTNAAYGWCFTDSRETGVDAEAGGDALYLYMRQTGAVQILNNAGSTATGYTLAQVGATAGPGITAGDVQSSTYQKQADGTALVTFQKGATVSTWRITPAPPLAFVAPMIRGAIAGTGTAGSASNYKARLRAFSWSDPTLTVQSQTVSQTSTNAVMAAVSPLVAPYGSPITHPAPATQLARVTPSPFVGALPILPVQVNGPGDVQMSATALEAFLAKYPEIMAGDIAYVMDGGGAPGTAVVNDRTKPFTLNYALQSTTAQLIIAIGPVSGFDFRNTHTNGALPKAIIAERQGQLMRIASADTLAGLTWTSAGSGRYTATYTGTYGGTALHRIVRRDILDAWGYPISLYQCADLTELAARDIGWHVDTGTKTISIKYNGADIHAIRSQLVGEWLDSAGNSRNYIQGTEVCIAGFRLDGVQCALNENAGALPTLWIDDCEIVNNPGYAIGEIGGEGSRVYATRIRGHSSEFDTINLNSVAARDSVLLLAGSHLSNAGDPNAFAARTDVQLISSHSGLCLIAGSLLEDATGQLMADTSLTSVQNATWLLGTRAVRRVAMTGSEAFGFYGGAGPDREVWIDTTEAANVAVPLRLQNGASAKIYNSPTLTATLAGGSVAPVSYTPDAPG